MDQSQLKDYCKAVAESVPIEEIVSRYYMPLNRDGKVECPFHNERTPSFSIDKNKNFFSCFGCGKGGDGVKFVSLMKDIGNYEAAKMIDEDFGLGLKSMLENGTYRPTSKKEVKKPVYNFSDKIKVWHEQVGLTDYFMKRGFTKETIERFKLGYDNSEKWSNYPYIIPVTKNYFIRRCKDKDAKKKTLNPSGGKVEMLQKELLFQDKEDVFVVEGWADAMSIEQCGKRAVSINGATNWQLLKAEKDKIKARLIMLGDPDSAGCNMDAKIEEFLGTPYCIDKIPEPYHDANDMLVADPTKLVDFLNKEREFKVNIPLDKKYSPENIPNITREELFGDELRNYYRNLQDLGKKSLLKLAMIDKAKELKIYNVFLSYSKSLDANSTQQQGNLATQKQHDLTVELPMEYDFGGWVVADDGVFRITEKSIERGCTHPLVITKILVNKITDCEKVELSYFIRNKWHRCLVDKSTIADPRAMVVLANKGIKITTSTAKTMVEYLYELEANNVGKIPEVISISRLGWTPDGKFSPYCNYEFDGEAGCEDIFNAMRPKGDYDKSLWALNKARENFIMRMMVGASMSSPLIQLLNSAVYFFHLWGETGLGKSVALKIKTSIWGNYEEMLKSLNSTGVALEKLAAFYCNVPLSLDELQSMKDRENNLSQIFYALSVGKSKSRSNVKGGIDSQDRWFNVIITNGEQPVTSYFKTAGASNRVIEMYLQDKMFENPKELLNITRENYGLLGKKYVEYLQTIDKEALYKQYLEVNKELQKLGFEDKQLVSMTLATLGDIEFNTQFNGMTFDVAKQDIISAIELNKNMFKNQDEILMTERIRESITSWVAGDVSRFDGSNSYNETYGKFEDENKKRVFIKGTNLRKHLEDENFEYVSSIKALIHLGVIEPGEKQNTVTRVINGIKTSGYIFRLEQEQIQGKLPLTEMEQEKMELIPVEDDSDLPF